MRQKTVYIIPGFHDNPRGKEYKAVVEKFQQKGFDAMVVAIQWNRKTMSDYIEQFRIIARDTEGEVYFFGFSFGAMLALAVAAEMHPKGLFLCSLSPYFAEDLKTIPISWKKYVGKKRMEDFSERSFATLAPLVKCRTFLFLGELEAEKFPCLAKRVKEASKKIKHSSLTVIPNAKHDLRQAEYQKAIATVIDEIL